MRILNKDTIEQMEEAFEKHRVRSAGRASKKKIKIPR